MWYICWRQNLFIEFQKNMLCCIIQPQPPLLGVFGILTGHQWVISMQICHKKANEPLIVLRGSAVQKLQAKCFSVQIWIIKKYAYVSKKLMVMTPWFFDILKELLNIFQTSGNAFWYITLFSRYRWNRNYQNFEWISMMSSRKSADISQRIKYHENVWPNLSHMS